MSTKEKTRKCYTLLRQFNEKLRIRLGCPRDTMSTDLGSSRSPAVLLQRHATRAQDVVVHGIGVTDIKH